MKPFIFSYFRFISQLLRLLLCCGEKYAILIQKHIKDLVGHEMSPSLYPILFDQIKAIVDKFFDQQGQVSELVKLLPFIKASSQRTQTYMVYDLVYPFEGSNRTWKYSIHRTSGVHYENGTGEKSR